MDSPASNVRTVYPPTGPEITAILLTAFATLFAYLRAAAPRIFFAAFFPARSNRSASVISRAAL